MKVATAAQERMVLTLEEVAKHNTSKCVVLFMPPPLAGPTGFGETYRSCWVIIKNKVYDVPDFLPVSLPFGCVAS